MKCSYHWCGRPPNEKIMDVQLPATSKEMKSTWVLPSSLAKLITWRRQNHPTPMALWLFSKDCGSMWIPRVPNLCWAMWILSAKGDRRPQAWLGHSLLDSPLDKGFLSWARKRLVHPQIRWSMLIHVDPIFALLHMGPLVFFQVQLDSMAPAT